MKSHELYIRGVFIKGSISNTVRVFAAKVLSACLELTLHAAVFHRQPCMESQPSLAAHRYLQNAEGGGVACRVGQAPPKERSCFFGRSNALPCDAYV